MKGAGISLASLRTQPLGQRAAGAAWQHRKACAGYHSWLKQQPLLAWEEQITSQEWCLQPHSREDPPSVWGTSAGNLSYKPQLENGKKKWKYETMARIAGRFQTDKYFRLTTIPVLESSSIKLSARPSHPRTINTKTYFNSCFHRGQYQRIETSYRSTYILMYCGVIYCTYKDIKTIFKYTSILIIVPGCAGSISELILPCLSLIPHNDGNSETMAALVM